MAVTDESFVTAEGLAKVMHEVGGGGLTSLPTT